MADFDIAEVLGKYGIYVPMRSGYSKIPCPWHEDRHPSASVRQNRLHCFSCGWDGDAIDVIKQQEDCSYADAVEIAEAITGTSREQVRGGASAGSGLFGGSGNNAGNGRGSPAWGGLFG